ncbi:MAG: hypothetical protein GY803_24670 [Chloroflexi bacterium]|nr:hypothetical protein [Chloroflexota bacterium]
MAIILNNYAIPEKGQVDIDFQLSFEIKYTAVQAKSSVNSWLLNEISYLIGADMPTLVLHQRPAWRVPAWLTLPGTKHKEFVGAVDVDVETGQIVDSANRKAQLEQYLHENSGKLQVSQTLADVELTQMITALYSQPPVANISDDEILAEVKAVRQLF